MVSLLFTVRRVKSPLTLFLVSVVNWRFFVLFTVAFHLAFRGQTTFKRSFLQSITVTVLCFSLLIIRPALMAFQCFNRRFQQMKFLIQFNLLILITLTLRFRLLPLPNLKRFRFPGTPRAVVLFRLRIVIMDLLFRSLRFRPRAFIVVGTRNVVTVTPRCITGPR